MMKKYQAFLSENNLKNTTARRILFETAISQKGHFSIENILSAAQKQEPGIGLATVYRFLGILTQSGILAQHNFGEKTLFEVNHNDSHHDHLICEKCGKIVEFECPEIENFQDKIAEQYDFELTEHRHELYGICGNCR